MIRANNSDLVFFKLFSFECIWGVSNETHVKVTNNNFNDIQNRGEKEMLEHIRKVIWRLNTP